MGKGRRSNRAASQRSTRWASTSSHSTKGANCVNVEVLDRGQVAAHNSRQGSNRAPPEVLCIIFDFYQRILPEENFGTMVRQRQNVPELTAWCSYWRSVALSFTSLWSNIHISTRGAKHPGPPFMVFNVDPTPSLESLDSYLDRCGFAINVNIALYGYRPNTPYTNIMTNTMVCRVYRKADSLKSLRLWADLLYRPLPLPAHLPSLESLMIHLQPDTKPILDSEWRTVGLFGAVPSDYDPVSASRNALGRSTPRLCSLSINEWCMETLDRSWLHIDLRQLCKLYVTVDSSQGAILCRLLTRAPLLTTLSITIARVRRGTLSVQAPNGTNISLMCEAVVSLPRLTSMRLELGESTLYQRIPHHFWAPALEHLQVDHIQTRWRAVGSSGRAVHRLGCLLELLRTLTALKTLNLPWCTMDADPRMPFDANGILFTKHCLVVFNISIDLLVRYGSELMMACIDGMPELRCVILESFGSADGEPARDVSLYWGGMPTGWKDVYRRLLDTHSRLRLISGLEAEPKRLEDRFVHDRFLVVKGKVTSREVFDVLRDGDGCLEGWLMNRRR